MTLADYLNKILRGEAINFEQFIKKLPKDDYIDRHNLFLPTMVAPKQHLVEVLDQERFYQLIKAFETPGQSRADAALSGDSHKSPTSFSHLLVFHDKCEGVRPDVVVIHNDELNQPFKAKEKLLIIENEENFFRFNELMSLLSDFAGCTLDLSDTDIVYGAGNQINKGLNLSFFEQYHSVFCAFDWDLGGLGMYKTLKSRLDKPVTFLLPNDLSPFKEHFRYKPRSNEQWLAAVELAQSLGFTELVSTFKTSLGFLEQEVWLSNQSSVK